MIINILKYRKKVGEIKFIKNIPIIKKKLESIIDKKIDNIKSEDDFIKNSKKLEVYFILETIINKIFEEKFTKFLYLKEGNNSKNKDVIKFIEEIKKIGLDIKYISKEKGLEYLKNQDLELGRIIERQNPLPNSFNITVKKGYNLEFEIKLNKYKHLFNLD